MKPVAGYALSFAGQRRPGAVEIASCVLHDYLKLEEIEVSFFAWTNQKRRSLDILIKGECGRSVTFQDLGWNRLRTLETIELALQVVNNEPDRVVVLTLIFRTGPEQRKPSHDLSRSKKVHAHLVE